MKYTLNQLNIFLKVVQHESITKTAEELFMTQPAVSIQLKNFQDQFDIPLTEVIKKRLYVTDFGREIAVIAGKILTEIENIKYKTEAFKGILTGKLRISSASTGKYVLPFFLSEFVEQHRGVDLSLDVTNKKKVVKSLIENEIDFALVSVLPDEVEVEEEQIMDNKLYMVGGMDEHEADKRLIFREEGSATRKAMEDHLKNRGIDVKKRIELTSNEAVKQAIIAGLGRSIVPLIGLRNELTNGDIRVVPTEELPIISRWRFIWLKHKTLSPVAGAYLDFIRQKKVGILREKFSWYEKYDT